MWNVTLWVLPAFTLWYCGNSVLTGHTAQYFHFWLVGNGPYITPSNQVCYSRKVRVHNPFLFPTRIDWRQPHSVVQTKEAATGVFLKALRLFWATALRGSGWKFQNFLERRCRRCFFTGNQKSSPGEPCLSWTMWLLSSWTSCSERQWRAQGEGAGQKCC